jgi:hypothetical protein
MNPSDVIVRTQRSQGWRSEGAMLIVRTQRSQGWRSEGAM